MTHSLIFFPFWTSWGQSLATYKGSIIFPGLPLGKEKKKKTCDNASTQRAGDWKGGLYPGGQCVCELMGVAGRAWLVGLRVQVENQWKQFFF
jgi:hypothetical protein